MDKKLTKRYIADSRYSTKGPFTFDEWMAAREHRDIKKKEKK